jgi:hypothetical protein
MMTGGNPETWYVTKVTAAARQTVGQWPTAESLTASLAEAFGSAAEERAARVPGGDDDERGEDDGPRCGEKRHAEERHAGRLRI